MNRKSQWNLLVGSMPQLHAYVRRLVGTREAANEILQEVSLRILSSDGPTEPERFLAWARGIARHVVALDWRTRQRARTQLPLEGELMDELEQPAVGADPEAHIDARASLARAMGGIDSEGMELLVRRYVFEETGKELADQLSQTPAAVRMRLMRLRSALSARAGRRVPEREH